jgi:ribose-phosphate pyrophosphokinase
MNFFKINVSFKRGCLLLTGASSFYLLNSYLRDTIQSKNNQQEEVKQDPLFRSRNFIHLGDEGNVLIFSGESNKELAEEVAARLGHNLGKAKISRFADGECNIQIYESIRGKDIYIIQPTCPPVNENFVELMLMISTFKRTSANKITAIIPYYGYGRADRKMNSRVPISAADTAKLLETMGVDRVMAVDLHAGQIQGFFGPSVPVDNLESQIIMVESLLNSKLVKDFNNLVIVSPDAGGVYRAKSFAEILSSRAQANVGLTMIVKQRIKANEIAKMELVGNVKGSECIIIDDIIDTAVS